MALLSVIVPVYNMEKYLSRCLDSIINQTLHSMEIICVDDGSTDSSPAILEHYAKVDKRIHIIKKKNGGLVSARKAGVRAAGGIYIGYVDSDDWIEPDMYEKLCEYGIRDRADMVTSGYFFEGNYITIHYDDVPEGLYGPENMDFLRENAIFNMKTEDVGIRGSLCCKIFNSKKFKKVQLDIPEEVSMSEDKLCILSYLLCCNRVSVRKQAFYHYMMNQESMVHTPDTGYLSKVNEVYQYFIKLYDHPLFTKTMRMQAELYITEMLYKGINSRMGFENKNLFWIDPYWLQEIPHGSRVALYGGGALGHVYRRQLENRGDLSFVGCMDFGWEKFAEDSLTVVSPEELVHTDYDMVVITIKNVAKMQEVKGQLTETGVPEYKIHWFEQKEIYWKYAEVNGWIK
ncbi:MAG: glycosyltransferase [Lachnospiraceae bacterium]|nr:glycosyltransferase [Lachnospiraceae bacterium]